MIPVGILSRVSTEDQAKGESPERHIQSASDYVKNKNNWQVVKIYRLDGVSGKSTMKRPEIQEMLHDARTGVIKALVISKLARLARNAKELLEFAEIFKEIGLDLISLGENIDTSTPSGFLVYGVLAVAAQFEREEVSDRVKTARIAQAKRGLCPAAVAPYGYENQDGVLVPDPKESAIKALAFELFLGNDNLSETARELNARGYRARRDKLWDHRSVKTLIKDTTVMGEYYANRTTGNKPKPKEEWIKIDAPSLVPFDDWQRAQLLLREKEQKQSGRKAIMPYSGLLMCSCGTKMYYRTAYKKTRPYDIYFCRQCGRHSSIRMDTLDELIGKTIIGFIVDPPNPSDVAQTSPINQLLKSTEDDLRLVLKQKKKLIEAHQADVLSLADLKLHYAPLEKRQLELQQELERLTLEVATSSHTHKQQALSARKLESIKWTDLELQEKGEILRQFVRAITLHQHELEVELLYMPESVLLSEDVCKRVSLDCQRAPRAR